MPPRTTAQTRPTTSDQLVGMIQYSIPSRVIVTGITANPQDLPSAQRNTILTAQQAMQFLTSEGQPYEGATPDFVLKHRTSLDKNRITDAISQATRRGLFT